MNVLNGVIFLVSGIIKKLKGITDAQKRQISKRVD